MNLNIEEMTDEECLTTVLAFLENRVTINTGLLRDEETGNVTHQVVRIECGEFATVSQPRELDTQLRIATPAETGVTVQ